MSQTGRYHLLGKYIFTDDQWPFAKALAVALCLTFLYAGMYLWERYGT
jgi:ABC-type spermidine/putrescine transport system permease subunit I